MKLIGVSYPFLVDSPTSGKIFLSAFLHIMRNYGLHVINTSSLSEQAASMEQINNARILSDAVLDIRQDEEKKNVILSGEGLITKANQTYYIHTRDDHKAAFEFVPTKKNKEGTEAEERVTSPMLNVFVVEDKKEDETTRKDQPENGKDKPAQPNP